MGLGRLFRDARVAMSRNLFPSTPEKPDPLGDIEGVEASIDIDEPLTIRAGQTIRVRFRYRAGVPNSTAFGLTWYATEDDANLLQNALQDEPLPAFLIDPPYPRRDTGALQSGTVTLTAPQNMRAGIIWGVMAIYQEPLR